MSLSPLVPVRPTLGGVLTGTRSAFEAHAGPLLLVCAAGVGVDALFTYVGNFITVGYGEPIFAVLSVVLQEVLYFGPAALIWRGITAARAGQPVTDSGDTRLLLSGFSDKRAWGIAIGVTLLYITTFSLLLCIGTVLGGFLLWLVPGAFTVAVKVLRTIIGPVMGIGYLATAIAVARPKHSIASSILASATLMLRWPLLAGLMLSVGGFFEQAAGMTLVLGILLDAAMLAYAGALVRTLMDAGELQS